MKKYFRFIYLLILLAFCVSCTNWTNPTPDYINPEYASFDNGRQDSGIICVTFQIDNFVINDIGNDGLDTLQTYISNYGQGFIVSNYLVKRYNALIKDNNSKTKKEIEKIVENFGVYVILKNKYYYMTKQGMSQFLILNDKYKLQHTLQNK